MQLQAKQQQPVSPCILLHVMGSSKTWHTFGFHEMFRFTWNGGMEFFRIVTKHCYFRIVTKNRRRRNLKNWNPILLCTSCLDDCMQFYFKYQVWNSQTGGVQHTLVVSLCHVLGFTQDSILLRKGMAVVVFVFCGCCIIICSCQRLLCLDVFIYYISELTYINSSNGILWVVHIKIALAVH